MIDLSAPKKHAPKQEEPSLIVMIVCILPFALLMWKIITTAFIGGF